MTGVQTCALPIWLRDHVETGGLTPDRSSKSDRGSKLRQENFVRQETPLRCVDRRLKPRGGLTSDKGSATTEISHADSADREGDFFNEGDEVNKMRQMVMLRDLRNRWTREGQGALL